MARRGAAWNCVALRVSRVIWLPHVALCVAWPGVALRRSALEPATLIFGPGAQLRAEPSSAERSTTICRAALGGERREGRQPWPLRARLPGGLVYPRLHGRSPGPGRPAGLVVAPRCCRAAHSIPVVRIGLCSPCSPILSLSAPRLSHCISICPLTTHPIPIRTGLTAPSLSSIRVPLHFSVASAPRGEQAVPAASRAQCDAGVHQRWMSFRPARRTTHLPS